MSKMSGCYYHVRKYYPYPDRKERKSNIHSLKTMAAVRVAVHLWKNHDTPYKKVENNFYFAYRRMEYSCEVVEAKVKKMLLPAEVKREIINIMDFKVHFYNCMNYYYQDDMYPAELFEEYFWKNQLIWRRRKRRRQ